MHFMYLILCNHCNLVIMHVCFFFVRSPFTPCALSFIVKARVSLFDPYITTYSGAVQIELTRNL